jgi:hypothetical protein
VDTGYSGAARLSPLAFKIEGLSLAALSGFLVSFGRYPTSYSRPSGLEREQLSG